MIRFGALFDRITAVGFDLFMAPLERWRLRRIRSLLLLHASGDVLEIGAGTGVNLGFYDATRITTLSLSDRDDRRHTITRRIQRLDPQLQRATEITVIDAQRLPYPDNSFDTVVATLLFCSVDCPLCGFDEIQRVLRPSGRYLFLEHVLPKRSGSAWLFTQLNPVWNTISRGCNLNRETAKDLQRAGFTLDPLYEEGDDGVFVWGVAHPPVSGSPRSGNGETDT